MERKTMPRIVALLLAVLLTCTSIFSAPVEAQAATSATKITLSARKSYRQENWKSNDYSNIQVE